MTDTAQNAELAVIGAALTHRSQAPLLVSELGPDDFGDPVLGQVWRVIQDCLDDGVRPDAGLVSSRLPQHDLLERLAQASWLAPEDAAPHAAQVKDDAAVRAVMAIGSKLAAVARPTREDAQGAVERMVAAMMRGQRSDGESFSTAIERALEHAVAIRDGLLPKGMMTGIADLDDRLGGLRPGDLIAVGARPGLGKTSLLRNIAHGAAMRSLEENDRVAFISLEMDAAQIGGRQASASAYKIDPGLAPPYSDLRRGSITDAQASLIREAAALPAGYRVHFRPGCSLAEARAIAYHEHAAAMADGGRLAMICVDYLQLMDPPPASRLDLAYGLVTQGLKRLGQELGCVMVLAAQLNRGNEKQGRRPRLSDFREVGSLEQDADQVVFLHNENEDPDEAYRDGRDATRSLTAIIDKNRHGQTGDIELYADYAHDVMTSAARRSA